MFSLSILITTFFFRSSAVTAACDNDSTFVKLYTSNIFDNRSHFIYISKFDLDSGIVENCQQQQTIDGIWHPVTYQTAYWEKTDTTKDINGKVLEYLTLTGSPTGWINKSSVTFNYSLTQKLINITTREWNGSSWDSTSIRSIQYNQQDQPVLDETYSFASGIRTNQNLVELTYNGGNIFSKRFASGTTGNVWKNDSLFNFSYSGSTRISAEINYWDSSMAAWTLSGQYTYSSLNDDWVIHIDKLNSKLLSGNLIYDEVSYELDTLETIVFIYNKIFTFARPAPGDYYRFVISSVFNDRIDGTYVVNKTISGDYFMEVQAPGDTMVANFTRDVVEEYFYNSSLQLLNTEYHGGCTNPCGGDSQYFYDSTGFMTGLNSYNWTMTSDRYYYTNYSHYSTSTPTIVVPEWERNIFVCDSTPYQPNLIIAGGCPPYSVQWSPAIGLSDPTILNPEILPGDSVQYTILITDANGIQNTAMYSVNSLHVSTEITVDSSGCPGSVTLEVPYNNEAYYVWYKNGQRISGFQTNQLIVTQPGNYSLTASRSYYSPYNNTVECMSVSDTIAITIPTGINTFEQVNLCSGSLYALPDGNIVELPGVYFSTLISSAGCDSIIETTITLQVLPEIIATADPLLCYGDTGLIIIDAVNGTAPYSGTGNFRSTAGTYMFTVTDSYGCADTDTVTLAQPPALTADAGTSLYLCSAGQVQLGNSPTASGGTGALSYLWSPSAPLISSTDSNPIANVNLSTIFNVTVTDANGCDASSNVLIQISDLIPPVISATGNVLNANSNGINYDWYYNNTMILSGNFPTMNAMHTGQYGVIVSDAQGCNYTSSLYNVLLNSTTQLQQNLIAHIYPNPAKDFIYVGLSESANNSVLKLFDITGNILKEIRVQGMLTKIDLSEIASGIYIVSIDTDSGIFHEQILISK